MSVAVWAATEKAREFASGAVISAAEVGTADKTSAGEGETDGGVNFAATVGLDLYVFVVVVPESEGWSSSPLMCNETGLPQAGWQEWGMSGDSLVPPETSQVEPPACNTVMSMMK